jgi:AraC-like DNA-binding protein
MSLQLIDLPKEGVLLYEFKHVDGDVVKKHHHQFHQILYALEGEGKILLNEKVSAFKHDCVAVIAPKSEHSIISASKLTVLVLAFDESIFDKSIQNELIREFFNMSYLYHSNTFNSNELRQLLRKALFEQGNESNLRFLAMKVFLAELMIVLARTRQTPHLWDANSLRAERIRHFIDTHYFEIMRATDIAAKHGISSRYLNTIFKEQFKTTPMQYLIDIRIDMAKKMLVETNKDIASICFELGFETVSTFYRIFKGTVRIPPNKYRSLYKMQAGDTATFK